MRISTFIFILLFLSSCVFTSNKPLAQNKTISQFEKAGWSDLLIDKNGVYHAVFQEYPDIGKPLFIYYSSSANKGATWSKPIALSYDNTGNGAGYAKIIQDGSGRIYAIWKRYGKSAGEYPKQFETLDGPGGYAMGTLYYKVLSGGVWSSQVKLNELEYAQESWFATLTPAGNVQVFWTQVGPDMIKNKLTPYWYYSDYLRTVTLNGTSFSAYIDLTVPTKAAYEGGNPAENNGAINLDGYIDQSNKIHLIYEDAPKETHEIKYFDGKSERIVHTYPTNQEGNTYLYPPKLLVDESGNDHLIFVPSPATLESEQIWDINLTTNQTNVIASIQQTGVKITGFQAAQGPHGAMAVTIEVYTKAFNQEAYGMFYNNGVWKNIGLTNNASKEKVFTKDFGWIGPYKTTISSLTKYNSTFCSVAYDAAGKKSMLMTISAAWSSGSVSTDSPSIVFIPIDH